MQTAKQDVEALMNDGVSFAEQMLRDHGEFLPFGRAMKTDGEIVHLAGYNGVEHPPSQEIIELLNDDFRSAARQGKYKATALFYDVRLGQGDGGDKSDAVAVALDHRDEYSVVVYFPYALQDGALSFGDLLAEKGTGRIFGQ